MIKIAKEERVPAALILTIVLWLQSLMVGKFCTLLSDPSQEAWMRFMRNYHMSGFDPISYGVLRHWHMGYDVLRHPLLAFMMWPLSELNLLLRSLTGADCAVPVMAALLTVCSFAAFMLLWRTLRRVVGVTAHVATLLTLFFMSFAYIMLTVVVADHFCLSLAMLMLTLYRAGTHLRSGTRFGTGEAVALFAVTAGITLSNGVAVLMAVLYVNGRRAFRPRFFLCAVAVPSVLMLALGIGLAQVGRGSSSASVGEAVSVMDGTRAATDAAPDAATKSSGDAVEQQFKWTRHNIPRTAVAVENLFGESLQLHRRHLLGDVLSRRPVIVEYSWKAQYAVEAFIVVLFVTGVFAGRRQRFERLLMGVFAFNMLLHVGLGFALDEVHIMAAHWTFVIPLSVAWLFCLLKRRQTGAFAYLLLFALLSAVTLYLFAYHGYLLHRYLTWPLCK